MPQTSDEKSAPQDGTLCVDTLAHTALNEVSNSTVLSRSRRVDAGTLMLVSRILRRGHFDCEIVRSELESLRIRPADIVDLCIPCASAELGLRWLDDTLSFAEVSAASSRLFSLLKHVGQDWENRPRPENARSILMATVAREDHPIGPAVATEQLRRRGHSVRLLSNATAEMVEDQLLSQNFDALFLSVSSVVTIDPAAEVVKHIRQSTENSTPIILGGAVLDHCGEIRERTGAHVVTKDLDIALDSLTSTTLARDLRAAG